MFNKKARVAKDIKILVSSTVGGNRARLAKQSNNIDIIKLKINPSFKILYVIDN